MNPSLRLLALLFAAATLSPPGVGAEPAPAEIFNQRILPIFRSPNPSSCVECHLAGVDLKNYIRPSHEETFLSLRDQGLVDIENPRASKILRLITMQEGKAAGAALVHKKVRAQEMAAFTAWLEASTRDPKLRTAPKLPVTSIAQPTRPNEIIRHTRVDRILQSFEDTIWAQRFRCTGCHLPGGTENAKLVAKHGEEINWLRTDADATMRYLIASELIDTKQPERSLLLRKPLEEVKHGGGKKMVHGDLGYKAWRSWIDDYAKTVNDSYARAADIPPPPNAPATFPSKIWLKFTNTAPEWSERLLQVTVFPRNATDSAWDAEPIAVSDRLVSGKMKLWQHELLLLARRDSPRAKLWVGKEATLPPGRYLLRVHVDRANRLATSWQAAMGESELVGETVIDSKWPAGYGAMTTIDAATIRR